MSERLIQTWSAKEPEQPQTRGLDQECPLDGKLAISRVFVARMGLHWHATPLKVGQNGSADGIQVPDHDVRRKAERKRRRGAAIGNPTRRRLQRQARRDVQSAKSGQSEAAAKTTATFGVPGTLLD